jgi:hypothetical protein
MWKRIQFSSIKMQLIMKAGVKKFSKNLGAT